MLNSSLNHNNFIILHIKTFQYPRILIYVIHIWGGGITRKYLENNISFLIRQIHSSCHCSCKPLLRENICIHILSINYRVNWSLSTTRSRSRPGTPAQIFSVCISICILIQWEISIPTWVYQKFSVFLL